MGLIVYYTRWLLMLDHLELLTAAHMATLCELKEKGVGVQIHQDTEPLGNLLKQ